ncbi:hypothetical protein [Psychrobacter immobilis]|uniref:DUF7281 domain-containing protein n=1 Tax=Psychrobacter immobilis TaxID=498 RepID=UPI0019191669|nr:hypothetical protein [Psychrobacter immobilis]
MDAKLAQRLESSKTLLDIQQKLQAGEHTIAFRTPSNVFALMVIYDANIGHKIGHTIYIKPGGWNRIVSLIKAHTMIDIARDDIAAMKTKDRVDNSLTMSNEKMLSKAPTEGFFELRLLGSDDDVVIATQNYIHRASKRNAYLGVHSDDLMQWNIDNLIVIENFTSFCRFTEQDLALIEGWRGQATALVYRGHKAGNTALIYESLKNINCRKYVFADYDFAGLSILQSIGKAILADGFILPREPWLNNDEMLCMNKKEARLVQSHITVNHPSLQPYYNHLKYNFLAITQEALMARSTPLTLIYT